MYLQAENGNDDDGQPLIGASPAKQEEKKRKSWFWSISNLAFLYFCIGLVLELCCVVYYQMDSAVAYIVAGLLGMIICLYGFQHFKTIMGIKVNVDEYYELNKKFRGEHREIRKDVDRLSAANRHLNQTHHRLESANAKNRENLDGFRGVQRDMSQFGAESVEQLTIFSKKSKNLEDKWKKELFQHERNLLHTVFDRFCTGSNHIGMTREEFQRFSDQLPRGYQERLSRLGTFDKLSANKSVILLEDFEKTLDIFAEMHVNGIDIEFEFKPTKKKRKTKPTKTKPSIISSRSLFDEISIDKSRSITNRKNPFARFLDTGTENINMTNLNDDNKDDSDSDWEDDREYDENLLLYDRNIVITKRGKEAMNVDFDLYKSGRNIFNEPKGVQRKKNVGFGLSVGFTSKKEIDIKPPKPRKIESIGLSLGGVDMNEIDDVEFSNQAIDKFMKKVDDQKIKQKNNQKNKPKK